MPELADSLRRIFGRLLGPATGNGPAAPLAQVDAVADGATAIALTEVFCAEAAALSTRSGGTDPVACGFEREALRHRANLLGRPLEGVGAPDPRGALATALGLSASGLRATAFLGGGDLEGARDLLGQAARRHLPLVVHLAGKGGHQAYHAATDAGLVQLFAATVQQAVDFTLLGRRVAEQSLVPVLVAVDWEEVARSLQDVRLPTRELVLSYLGRPEDRVQTPTAAQRTLFGAERRQLPSWYDLERPALIGASFGAESGGLVAAGQRPFFYDHVPALLEQAAQELAQRTGRAQGLWSEHRLEGAEVVLVVQGAAVEVARRVADHLRAEKKVKVGVLGVGCLRPLPGHKLATLLGGARKVVVLDRVDAPLSSDAPLLTEVALLCRRALENGRPGTPAHPGYPVWRADKAPALRSLLYGLGGHPLRAADLAEAALSEGASPAYLGIRFSPGQSPYPRRQAMLDALSRDYPGLRALEAVATAPLNLEAKGVCGQVHRLEGQGGEQVLASAACALQGASGGFLRTRTMATGERFGRVAVDRLGWAQQAERALPDDELSDATLVCGLPGRLGQAAAEGLREGGVLLVNFAGSNAELAAALTPRARALVDERRLVVCLTVPVEGEAPAQAEERMAGALLAALARAGGLELSRRKLVGARKEQVAASPAELVKAAEVAAEALGDGFETLAAVELPEQPAKASPPVQPSAPATLDHLRPRDADAARAVDSLPRFFGEVGVLYENGDEAGLSADPHLSSGVVAPLSAALRDGSGSGAWFPAFEPTLCDGCSRCWTACPEGAISPLSLGGKELLEGAMELAKEAGTSAEALRPMLSKLGPKLIKHFKETEPAPATAGALLREGCAPMLQGAALPEERKQAMLAAFEAVQGVVEDLPVARTAPFFSDPERAAAGQGELLTLAVDPSTCKGCGLCVAACEPKALVAMAPTAARLAQARATFSRAQRLPDTSGASIARTRQHPTVGELPALLLSRHTRHAVVGGDGAEAGSGAKIALRLVLAAAEYQLQRRLQGQVKEVSELGKKLSARLSEALGKALPTADLEALSSGLAAAARGAVSLAELTSKLPTKDGGGIDVGRARRLVEAQQELADLSGRLVSGPFGLGRARLGLVLAQSPLTEGLGTFPYNPFQVPALLDDSGEAAGLARGALEGQLRAAVVGLAAMRRAKLELDNPIEAALSDEKLSALRWEELTEEEKALCPPLVLVGGEGAFGDRALARLLEGGLPVKVVVLADGTGDGLGALSFGLSNQNAFVLQSSFAHPGHLGPGLLRAFEHPGPALLRILAPSPSLHGFPKDGALAQAQLAVASRAFPLFSFDPAKEGVFGTHLSLEGNPEPLSAWTLAEDGTPLLPAAFAAGQERCARWLSPMGELPSPTALHEYLALAPSGRVKKTPCLGGGPERRAVAPRLVELCARRAREWQVLQELCGLVTPFVERVQAQAKEQVEAAHLQELAALAAVHEGQLRTLRADTTLELSQQVKERLMMLSGYGTNGQAPGASRKVE